MRAIAGLAILLATTTASTGTAQQMMPIVVPPAPPIVATPAAPAAATPTTTLPAETPPGTSPDLVQTPVPPDNADSGNAALPPENATPGGPSPASGADADNGTAPVPPPPAWLPATTAKLGVLNEVDGSATQVQIPVGGQAQVGDLQVGIAACLRRPPDQIPDAAAFITAAAPAATAATPAQAAPAFSGWMLRSAPGAAVVGDASETFRVIDCS